MHGCPHPSGNCRTRARVLLSDRDWKRASAAKRTFPILEHGRQRERCGVWTEEKIANAAFIPDASDLRIASKL